MATSETNVTVNASIIHLEFDAPADGIHVGALGSLMWNINNVVWHLNPEVMLMKDGHPANGPAGVYVVKIQMNSPLTVALQLINIPKHVVKAVVGVLQNLMFYEQEMKRRQAMNAAAWEDVYAKRLVLLC